LGLPVLDPFKIPLLNTIILLSSGATVTLCHHALRANATLVAIVALFLTIVLGVEFTVFQISEYLSAAFSINDSVYGSAFYMLTGLHGLHVIVGTLFLFVSFGRLCLGHFTKARHLGLELAIWY